MNKAGGVSFSDDTFNWVAIYQYTKATNPNGSPNPVVASVLRGETFRGRAYVVNAWYITAYEPIYDSGKNVVGVLYVGIPQENGKLRSGGSVGRIVK